ncbi:MAG: 2Fe-2S iron-sulfur cluster binding domain-containing protein [Deltaproteobacteria bacterium]|nr:2Fe-2S iron-sulfur cluster binding domain-containing protein [Deltaproteobacteria bacterium]
MPKLRFTHRELEVDAADGEWLYDACDRSKSGVPFACKAGACGTCATEVLAGVEHLDPQGAREVRTLTENRLDPQRYRLLCLSDVHGDVTFGKPAKAPSSEASLATHQVVVESYRPLNLSVCEVRFFVETESFEFKPGQYMIFHIPNPGHAIRRSYSISTPPSDRRHFEICVRSVAGGAGSNFVHRLRPGRKLRVEGPYGDFVLDEASSRRILMIATGTGISPIRSMLMHLLDRRSDRRVRLFFGLRHESDLFYTDLFRGLAAHYPAFEHRITLSQPSAGGWSGSVGRVTGLIETEVTEDDAQDTDVYLCGGRDMIESSERLLLAKGFPKDRIHYESFY